MGLQILFKARGVGLISYYSMLLTPFLKAWLTWISGPPGVGKTLTAETLAETLRMPLYAVRLHDGSMTDPVDQPGSCGANRSGSSHGGSHVGNDFQDCQPLESNPTY